MKVELKEFQQNAVLDLLQKLSQMRQMHDVAGQVFSVCLGSPTGSGKTVMCAATIEALFFGDDELGVLPDENAVVLWLSDSPSLNDQTRLRLVNVSDKLADWINDSRHLETVNNNFGASHEMLEPRHVYFLSKDLLSKNGLLTKGGELNSGRVFWDILDRTIQDPERNLYLFIDEAHRGLGGNASSDKGTATIYANLIDGFEGRSAMPFVVGVSATPQRFEAAMDLRENRIKMPRVAVTPRDVQESGLLKDIIELRVPEKDDPVEHQYLTMACERFAQSCERWDEYCVAQGERSVTPLLLIQARDNVTVEEIAELCEQVMSIVPGLSHAGSFANVFGEHKDIKAGRFILPYIEPEFIQDRPPIRVLFAKEAVSNGWDCPRAEVIFSQRRRSDSTYIAQLVGRMVRTPLSRRIDGDDLLNSVACYLPQFNPDATQKVVDYLTGKIEEMGESSIGNQNIVLNPVTVEAAVPVTQEEYEEKVTKYEEIKKAIERAKARSSTGHASFQTTLEIEGAQMSLGDELVAAGSAESLAARNKQGASDTAGSRSSDAGAFDADKAAQPLLAPMPKPKPPTARNASFAKEEWVGIKAAFESIPVKRNPKKARNEFRSLLNTATLMIDIGFYENAADEVNHIFVQALDGAIITYGDAYGVARYEVEIAETVKITLDRLNETQTQEQEIAKTDPEGLKKAARDADNKFGKELTQAFRRAHFSELGRPETDLRLAAAVRTPEIVDSLEEWAAKLRMSMFDAVDGSGEYSFMSDADKQRYDELARETEGKRLTRIEWPRTQVVSDNGEKYPRHIVQKEDGLCPLSLKGSEKFVVETELAKPRTVAFYRNPSASNSPQAFSIPYNSSVGRKALHPDFLFFVRDNDGVIKPAIVDPHGEFLSDTLAKLKGYVAYLQEFPDVFKQVQFVGDMGGGTYRVLNLLRTDVQEAIDAYSAVDCKALFLGQLANDYQ